MKDPKDGPLYDDFGNLIQAPNGGAFINERGNIEVRQAINPERIIERNAGCWNCVSFCTDTVYDAKVKASYIRDVAHWKSKGAPPAVANQRAAKVRNLMTAKKGAFGVCLVGKTEGDFVANRHLCESWTGVTGASLARAPGESLSPLIDEVLDKIDK